MIASPMHRGREDRTDTCATQGRKTQEAERVTRALVHLAIFWRAGGCISRQYRWRRVRSELIAACSSGGCPPLRRHRRVRRHARVLDVGSRGAVLRPSIPPVGYDSIRGCLSGYRCRCSRRLSGPRVATRGGQRPRRRRSRLHRRSRLAHPLVARRRRRRRRTRRRRRRQRGQLRRRRRRSCRWTSSGSVSKATARRPAHLRGAGAQAGRNSFPTLEGA